MNILRTLSSNIPKISITYSYIPSCLNVADKLTRISFDSVGITNCPEYRYLKGMYTKLLEAVEISTFLKVENGVIQYLPEDNFVSLDNIYTLFTKESTNCETCLEKSMTHKFDNIFNLYQTDINISAIMSKPNNKVLQGNLELQILGKIIQEKTWEIYHRLNYNLNEYKQKFPKLPMTKDSYNNSLIAKNFTYHKLLTRVAMMLISVGPKHDADSSHQICVITEALIAIFLWSQKFYP